MLRSSAAVSASVPRPARFPVRYRPELPAAGTPSSWPPASPSPAAPGGRPAAPPRTSPPPPAHHGRAWDTTRRAAHPLRGRDRENKLGCLFLKWLDIWLLREFACRRPTLDSFPLCRLGFVFPSSPLVIRPMRVRFSCGGLSGLGDNIFLFGGVGRAGGAQAETDGKSR